MPPALPVVRVHSTARNVGKTLLASRLIEELSARGYVVGALKHSHHQLPADKPGSDTEHFARAGATSVVFSASDGVIERLAAPESALEPALTRLLGRVDIAVAEGYRDEELGASLAIDARSLAVALTSMDGRRVLGSDRADIAGIATAIERLFELAPGGDARLRELVRRGAAAHGHRCPGVTLGVRMAAIAAGALALPLPAPRHRLEVVVETARCATDAIAAITGCSLGRRNLRVEERGFMAATFIDVQSGRQVRVEARESAKTEAAAWAPHVEGRRHQQAVAYLEMPERALFDITGPALEAPPRAVPAGVA